MTKLILDFETRSTIDLKKAGAWAYASHPSTDIICMGLAFGDGAVEVLTRDEFKSVPRLAADGIIVAHNVQFEYAVYHFILHKRYGWPAFLDPKRWDCTMARALTCGLPASLEGAALALRLPVKKDLEGRGALLKICKPRAIDGTFDEDPALYERVYQYNKIDVEAERALDRALPELSPDDRRVFELDLAMNRRGTAIDLSSARAAVEVAGGITDALNAELRTLTGGAVDKATRLTAMKRWVEAQGVKIPTKVVDDEEKETFDIEAVKDLFLDPKTPQAVKDVLRVRQQVGKSSVAKFQKMLDCACADGRIRGSVQYHGAHTGRWAGRLNQPQNYPQGLAGEDQRTAIAMLEQGSRFFHSVYEDRAMRTLSDCLRGMIVPSPGKIFVGADLSAIEARVVFWLAGEKEPLAGYARGESPYLSMGQTIYGRPIDKKKDPAEYDLAKRTVLGAGFGMGWARFQGNTYTETAKKGVPLEISDELAQRAIKAYREKYARVVGLWYEMEAAAVNAVIDPGKLFHCAGGRVVWGMSKDRQFLACKLPSGRLLRYFRPEVKAEEDKFGREKRVLYYWTAASEGAIRTDCNGLLGQYKTWGGELVENIVQAIARDVMVCGMLAAEKAGFSLVLTVHDELLAEVPWNATGLSPEYLVKLMTTELPSWLSGCPIAAEGWLGTRYRK